VHPRYGGWFALRGVIIIRTCQAPDMEQCHAPDVVRGDELRIKLLEQFNFNWQDWKWRDIIPTEAVYSDEQKEYFGTPPRQRGPLIQKIQSSTVSIPGIQGV
jgi:cyanocobalamin reductase (cyanide-eliminating) / alkylcobalamin dealkylase